MAGHEVVVGHEAEHEVAEHEVAGHEVAGHEVAGHEVPGHEVPGHEVPGHEEVTSDLSSVACEAIVVVLTAGGRGLFDRVLPVGVPVVAVISHGRDPAALGFDAADRSSLETRADAYVLGPRRLREAIEWVLAEDRAARTTGLPRLVVVGSINDDFGTTRSIPAEPLILGRARSFGVHPQRNDRMPTPIGTIARHHAHVRCVGGVIEVADLASTNGTIVLCRDQPARLLCPQQAEAGREFGPAATEWLVRDPSSVRRFVGAWHRLDIGDEIQLPGFWRFRIDGDPAHDEHF